MSRVLVYFSPGNHLLYSLQNNNYYYTLIFEGEVGLVSSDIDYYQDLSIVTLRY